MTSPKRNKNASQIACENIVNNLFTAEILNKEYVSYNTLKDAMGAKSTNAVTRLLTKLGYDNQPFKDTKSAEEKADVLYKTLKVFQLEGLKAYTNELKTKIGKEKAKQRLIRGKFPNGYKTKKKLEEQQKRNEEIQQNKKDQSAFDEWSD